MRKIFLSSVLLLGTAAVTQAAPDYMNVVTSSGQCSFAVEMVDRTGFDDSSLTVYTTDSHTIVFPNADEWTITFSDTPISSVEVTKAESLTPAKVYDLNGRCVLTAPSVSSLDLNSLPSGVYIINADKAERRLVK